MKIRPVTESDEPRWLRMRLELWPDSDAKEVRRFFEGALREPSAVLVAEQGDELIGFVELSIRAYAEGCDSDHVGYVEGWWVASDIRRRGVGRALIGAAEAWAREQGCVELASDAELTNDLSDRAHRACGFEETGQIRCFRKPLA